jgi:hypothetical protein
MGRITTQDNHFPPIPINSGSDSLHFAGGTYQALEKVGNCIKVVIPAKAGIQKGLKMLDSLLRGKDDKRSDDEERGF